MHDTALRKDNHMIIQVNTDSNVEGNREVAQQIEAQVENGLEHFGGKITRVEVHLSDENSDKKFGTKDMRCLLEARLAGLRPVTVSHQAATLEQAVEGAVEKLKRSLESTLGRLDKR
jgi:ribosome-associated translation inhibitor RaiA